MASIPEAAPASPPVSLDELQRLRRVTPEQGAAIFDGLLAVLAEHEAEGRRAARLDASSVLLTPAGTVALAEPQGVAAGAGAPTDVVAAARVARPLVAHGGRRMRKVEHLVEAAVEGRAAASALDVRRQLEVAAAPLGAGWNAPAALLPLVAPGAAVVAGGRRRRRWPWLVLAALVILAGAGAAVWFLALNGKTPSPPPAAALTIGSDMKVTVAPTHAGCNTTFVFHATASVTGAGNLVYRWEQSDGQTSDNQTLRVTSADGSFDITQAWRIQGAQTLTGKETFHIIQPVDRAIAVTFQYACS